MARRDLAPNLNNASPVGLACNYVYGVLQRSEAPLPNLPLINNAIAVVQLF
jgi:hypothetical protein